MQYFFGEVLVVIYWLSIKQMRNYKYFQKVFLKCSLFIKHLHFVPKQDTQCGKSKNSLEKYSIESLRKYCVKNTNSLSNGKKSWNQLTVWFVNKNVNFTEFLTKNGEKKCMIEIDFTKYCDFKFFRQIDLENW